MAKKSKGSEPQNPLTAFGRAIRKVRLEREMTQSELARLCGMHRTYIAGVERGERNISLLSMIRIAERLETELASLFEIAEL